MMSEVQILDQVQPDERCDCPLDHCTPEERTVIEAAVRDRQSETKAEGESYNNSFDRMIQSRREFRLAVTELLAARGKSPESSNAG